MSLEIRNTLRKIDPRKTFYVVALFLTIFPLTGCESVNNQALTPSSPTPTVFLSTDWQVCGTVDEEGEGPIQVLRQAAKGRGDPHEWCEFAEQQIVIIKRDGTVQTFSWEKLLEENPVVKIGDQVCDTVHPTSSSQ